MTSATCPRAARDIFNMAATGASAAIKDRFIVTARPRPDKDGVRIYDVADCPAVAANPKIVEELGLSDADPVIPTRQQVADRHDGTYSLAAGAYLWLADRLVILQRTGAALASGFLTNPSGFCDDIPSRVMHDEMLEESPITYRRDDVLVVPVLCLPDDDAATVNRKVVMKQAQQSEYRRQCLAMDLQIAGIVFEVLRVRERKVAPGLLSTVEIRDGDRLCDRFEAHAFQSDDKGIACFHKSYDVVLPDEAQPILLDGEGFKRPGFLLTPAELQARPETPLFFLADYAGKLRPAP